MGGRLCEREERPRSKEKASDAEPKTQMGKIFGIH
jgi:hypothetical protein